MKAGKLWMLSVLVAACVTGAASAEAHHKESSNKKASASKGDVTVVKAKGGKQRTYFHERGYAKLNIPPGHYPPPGQCRIWYPGRPPGRQPAPGLCRRLRGRVPAGAWLIYHPVDRGDVVHITAYDTARPGTILAVGEFNIGSGLFVRLVVNG